MIEDNPLFDRDFALIDALLIRYGRFDMNTLISLLRSKTSTARKLSSAYNKLHESIHGARAYKSVTVGHFALNTGSRHLEKIDTFKPLSTTHLNVEEYAKQLLDNHSTQNGLHLCELMSADESLVLISVDKSKGAKTHKHYKSFAIIETLFHYNDSVDLLELAEFARLENPSQARYIMSLYSKETKVEHLKSSGVYVKGDSWESIVPLTDFEKFELISSLD